MEHRTLGLQTLAEARDKKSTGLYIFRARPELLLLTRTDSMRELNFSCQGQVAAHSDGPKEYKIKA